MFALVAGHQTNQISEYLNGAASVNSEESVIKEKSVRIRGICGRISSQAASVKICGICGRISSQAASVKIRGICGRISSQAASVRIRGICGRTFSQAASEISMLITGCAGVSHRLRRSTRMWVRRMLKNLWDNRHFGEKLFGACFYQNRCGGLPPIPGRMPEGGGPILSGRPGPPGPRCP